MPAAHWRREAWPPAHLWPLTLALPRRRSVGRRRSGCEWQGQCLGAISGAVAGLVAITPAAGFVGPMSALAIGALAGVFCYLMVTRVKTKFGYDDSLDAFGVHGAGGTIGALLTGVFAAKAINPIFGAPGSAMAVGLIDGHAGQVLNQFVGVAIAWRWPWSGHWSS